MFILLSMSQLFPFEFIFSRAIAILLRDQDTFGDLIVLLEQTKQLYQSKQGVAPSEAFL